MPSKPLLVVATADPELRSRLSWGLSQANYHVVTTGDGALALELVSRASVTALVADVDVPGLSGIELVRRLRARDEAPPVLLLSDGTRESLARGHLVGAFQILEKPFTTERLVATLQGAMCPAHV